MWYMATLATPIVLGLWAVAPEVVLLTGREYAGAAPVLQVLILSSFLYFLISDWQSSERFRSSINKNSDHGCNDGDQRRLNILLIPRFGILGAR